MLRNREKKRGKSRRLRVKADDIIPMQMVNDLVEALNPKDLVEQVTDASSDAVEFLQKNFAGLGKATSGISIPFKKERAQAYQNISIFLRVLLIALSSMSLLVLSWTLTPVFHMSEKMNRRLVSYFEYVWVNMCMALVDPIEIVETGEVAQDNTAPKLFICNHVTDVDWVYLYAMANKVGDDHCGSVKIFMKKEMLDVPVASGGFRLFEMLFLARNWDKDKVYIEKEIERLCSVDHPLWLIFFPEGTTINTRTVEKSKAYAAQEGGDRPELDLTLLPRSRGFEHLLNCLNKYSKKETEVFDLTMNWDGYTGEIPTWEMGYTRKKDVMIPNFLNLLAGKCATTCHIDSRQFTVDEIMSHEEGVTGWLDERWARKNDLLHHFIEDNNFPGEQTRWQGEGMYQKFLKSAPLIGAAFLECFIIFILPIIIVLVVALG